MNKMLFASVMSVLISAAALFGIPSDELRVIKLTDLSQELLQDYFSGKCEDIVLECSEGTSLPLNLTMRGDFVLMEGGEQTLQTIRILNTCYIKCSGEEFLFSVDLETWKEFFDFFTGSFGIEIHLQENGVQIGCNVELNQK
ncbi:MAG: hypothetical protein ACHQUC_02235 [Chlamydiales bacterium]